VHEALNVALSAEGIRKLGWGASFERFAEFNEGMRARSEEYLCDRGASAPEHWEASLVKPFDVLFVLYAEDAVLLESRLAQLHRHLGGAGIAEVHCQRAGRLTGPPSEPGDGEGFGVREHFGFQDGFSQPAVEGSGRDAKGEGILRWPPELGRWRPLRLGEFLLGHLDEDRQIAGELTADSPLHNGTFMVWRKLRQEVVAFKDYFDGLDGEREMLEAKAVGRWQDGTSLEDSPWAKPATDPDQRQPGNAFSYADDEQGERCPIGAHVRRANPRTTLKWGTVRTRRHRLIRRGLPYTDKDGTVGLIFVCFNASIPRQFELVQGDWLMNGDAFGLGPEQDLLLGSGGPEEVLRIPGQGSRPARFFARGSEQFVVTRGGSYLFMPGIAALRRMAAGPPPRGRSRRDRPAMIALGLVTGGLVSLGRRLEQRGRVHNQPHAKLLGQAPRLPRQRRNPLPIDTGLARQQ